jgi:tetratricopeptide (TPR) repeat protein
MKFSFIIISFFLVFVLIGCTSIKPGSPTGTGPGSGSAAQAAPVKAPDPVLKTKKLEPGEIFTLDASLKKDPAKLLSLGFDTYKKGQYPQAKMIAAYLVNAKQSVAQAYLLMAKTYYMENDFAMASSFSDAAIAKDAALGEAYLIGANAALGTGNILKAMQYIGKGKSYNQKNPLYYYTNAMIYLALADYANAKANYLEAVNLDPNFKQAWSGLIVCLNKLGDTDYEAKLTAAFASWFGKGVK